MAAGKFYYLDAVTVVRPKQRYEGPCKSRCFSYRQQANHAIFMLYSRVAKIAEKKAYERKTQFLLCWNLVLVSREPRSFLLEKAAGKLCYFDAVLYSVFERYVPLHYKA